VEQEYLKTTRQSQQSENTFYSFKRGIVLTDAKINNGETVNIYLFEIIFINPISIVNNDKSRNIFRKAE